MYRVTAVRNLEGAFGAAVREQAAKAIDRNSTVLCDAHRNRLVPFAPPGRPEVRTAWRRRSRVQAAGAPGTTAAPAQARVGAGRAAPTALLEVWREARARRLHHPALESCVVSLELRKKRNI